MTVTTEEMSTGAHQADQFDQARADAFAEKLLATINGSAVTLMLSLGHRTGLFDKMAGQPPLTCLELAKLAGLNERYVREWLGALVAGGIVEYDPAAATYVLPAEHAAFLTRSSVPNNVAGVAQWLPVLAGVEEQILEAFQTGSGVPYEKFHRFHHVMAEESAQTVGCALFDQIIPLAPGLAERLEEGIEVIDIGCGAGRALCLMAAKYPRSRFTGIDLCADAVALASDLAREQGLANVRFLVHEAPQVARLGQFDAVFTFDAVHDQGDPAGLLAGIHKVLRPGGTYLMQDIGVSSHVEKNIEHPLGAFVYTISCFHCMSVSLAQGGVGLGAAWGEELTLQMLREAGFKRINVHRLPHDILNNYYVVQH
jgi:2-polyprenyl-3-methyl-5-hydroxy-6-metoxy-1,4-benzoquinol methylase